MICTKFAPSSSFSFELDLLALPCFDRSAILVEVTAVMGIVTLVQTSMLLAKYTVLFSPAHLFGLYRDAGVNRLHLELAIHPFCLYDTYGLSIEFNITLNILKDQQ